MRGISGMPYRALLLVSMVLLLASCTAVGQRTLLTVAYYTVSGDTFDELDREISLHGPRVTGVGKALASTDLRMVPDIQYQRQRAMCRVTRARINVKAKVTLPRHRNVNRLKQELASAWSNLAQYARIHEAVHLAIADDYAIKMEEAIKAIEPVPSCADMRLRVRDVFSVLFEEHHAEQLRFDASERERILRLQSRSNKSSNADS